jgi:cell division protein FtsL
MKPTAAAAQNASGHESEIRPEPGAAALERQGLLFREIQMRKERNKVRRRYVLMIIVAFLFSVALIFRYSFVIEINEQILRDKSTLTKLENENSLAQKQIAGETDLEKVRLIAESKLDMQKPDRDQIVYIRVPKKDHALVASAKRQDPDAMNPIEYLLEQIRLIHKRLISD